MSFNSIEEFIFLIFDILMTTASSPLNDTYIDNLDLFKGYDIDFDRFSLMSSQFHDQLFAERDRAVQFHEYRRAEYFHGLIRKCVPAATQIKRDYDSLMHQYLEAGAPAFYDHTDPDPEERG